VYLRSQNFLEPGAGYEPVNDEPSLLADNKSDKSDIEKDILGEILDSESDEDSTEEMTNMKYMHDQCAKRDYVIRRGRSNRILCRAINQTVFNDDLFWANESDVFFPEKSYCSKDTYLLNDQFKMDKKTGQIQSVARGENLYKQKYDDIWLEKKRDLKS
jgi:hypothetical protein